MKMKVISGGGSYLRSVIPNNFFTTTGEGHGITIGRKIGGFTSASNVLTEVLCNLNL